MSRRTARAGQITLGLLWLIDGALQFQPYMFGRSFVTGVLLPRAAAQPGVIGAPIRWIAQLIEPRVAPFNAFAATLEVLIGVGLLYRRTVRPALATRSCGRWGSGLPARASACSSPAAPAPSAVPRARRRSTSSPG